MTGLILLNNFLVTLKPDVQFYTNDDLIKNLVLLTYLISRSHQHHILKCLLSLFPNAVNVFGATADVGLDVLFF